MISLSGAIIGFNCVFGFLLLGRVCWQLKKRYEALKHNERVPSSANYSTLIFDSAIGIFLITVAVILSN